MHFLLGCPHSWDYVSEFVGATLGPHRSLPILTVFSWNLIGTSLGVFESLTVVELHCNLHWCWVFKLINYQPMTWNDHSFGTFESFTAVELHCSFHWCWVSELINYQPMRWNTKHCLTTLRSKSRTI